MPSGERGRPGSERLDAVARRERAAALHGVRFPAMLPEPPRIPAVTVTAVLPSDPLTESREPPTVVVPV